MCVDSEDFCARPLPLHIRSQTTSVCDSWRRDCRFVRLRGAGDHRQAMRLRSRGMLLRRFAGLAGFMITFQCDCHMSNLEKLNHEIIRCRACPRLVRYREQVARDKRRSFLAWDYWGRPVPGFGDPRAELLNTLVSRTCRPQQHYVPIPGPQSAQRTSLTIACAPDSRRPVPRSRNRHTFGQSSS